MRASPSWLLSSAVCSVLNALSDTRLNDHLGRITGECGLYPRITSIDIAACRRSLHHTDIRTTLPEQKCLTAEHKTRDDHSAFRHPPRRGYIPCCHPWARMAPTTIPFHRTICCFFLLRCKFQVIFFYERLIHLAFIGPHIARYRPIAYRILMDKKPGSRYVRTPSALGTHGPHRPDIIGHLFRDRPTVGRSGAHEVLVCMSINYHCL